MTQEQHSHTYRVIELVGSSPDGIEPAIENAIGTAGESLEHLDWFEVREIRGAMHEGAIGWYQVKIGLGYRDPG